MNLSREWVPLLASHGWESQHWSNVGSGNAPDTELMRWAREHGHVVLTGNKGFVLQSFFLRDSLYTAK